MTGLCRHWNCYPGARVDTDTPIYQLFDKELWEDFTFRERYAGWQELRRYFAHVDQKWQVSQYFGQCVKRTPVVVQRASTDPPWTEWNKNVESATFDEDQKKWLVECSDGKLT